MRVPHVGSLILTVAIVAACGANSSVATSPAESDSSRATAEPTSTPSATSETEFLSLEVTNPKSFPDGVCEMFESTYIADVLGTLVYETDFDQDSCHWTTSAGVFTLLHVDEDTDFDVPAMFESLWSEDGPDATIQGNPASVLYQRFEDGSSRCEVIVRMDENAFFTVRAEVYDEDSELRPCDEIENVAESFHASLPSA